MQTTTRQLSFAAVLLGAAALSAQTTTTPLVVGWVDGGTTTSGAVHTQDIDNGCQPAVAKFKALAGGTSRWSGGTAYDPRHRSVWVSDGTTIAEYRLADGKGLCKFVAQRMDSKAVVSGLAIHDKGRRLIQLETRAGYGAIRSYDLTKCPPTPLRDGCVLKVPIGYFSGGLAFDEVEGLVYYSITKPGFQVPYNWIHVADAKSRCKSICSLQIPTCLHFYGTDVFGLGYDSCNKTLYATVGMGTVPIQVVDARKCAFKVGKCCLKKTMPLFRGLAVIPGWSAFKKGQSCITKACPYCHKVDIELVGMPSLGNPEFAVDVVNGPTDAIGILGLGVSSCGKGIHFACGALWLPGNPFVFVAGKLKGPQCAATLRVPLLVPVDAKLCGQSVCLQWVVGCTGGGTGITPAVQFKIAGS